MSKRVRLFQVPGTTDKIKYGTQYKRRKLAKKQAAQEQMMQEQVAEDNDEHCDAGYNGDDSDSNSSDTEDDYDPIEPMEEQYGSEDDNSCSSHGSISDEPVFEDDNVSEDDSSSESSESSDDEPASVDIDKNENEDLKKLTNTPVLENGSCTKAEALLCFTSMTKSFKWTKRMVKQLLLFIQLISDGKANFPKTFHKYVKVC